MAVSSSLMARLGKSSTSYLNRYLRVSSHFPSQGDPEQYCPPHGIVIKRQLRTPVALLQSGAVLKAKE